MSGSTIKVAGLNEFKRGLRQLDRAAPKGIRTVLNTVAQLLVDETRPEIPHRSGAAAGSLRAQSTQTAARIAVGGAKAPYYPWLDFGGRTGRKKATVRPFYKSGRYIFPTLGRIQPQIERAMLEGLTGLARDAGLEVT